MKALLRTMGAVLFVAAIACNRQPTETEQTYYGRPFFGLVGATITDSTGAVIENTVEGSNSKPDTACGKVLTAFTYAKIKTSGETWQLYLPTPPPLAGCLPETGEKIRIIYFEVSNGRVTLTDLERSGKKYRVLFNY